MFKANGSLPMGSTMATIQIDYSAKQQWYALNEGEPNTKFADIEEIHKNTRDHT